MTILEDRPVIVADLVGEAEAPAAEAEASTATAAVGDDDGPVRYDMGAMARPLAASSLTCTAAALMVGGLFDSWSARLFAIAGVLFGAAWCYLSLRITRRVLVQLATFPVAFVVGTATMLVGSDPSLVGSLMGDAIRAGVVLRPPPFDPGWRPIVFVVMAMVAYGAGWLGTAVSRSKLGFALPLPLVFLTATTQPKGGELLAGVFVFVPILLGIAVLFGGASRDTTESLSAQFELRRAARSLPLVGLGVAVLILLNTTSVLFPKPRYDPNDKPQKPRSQPLGATRDRVLFEVQGPLTGPWKLGVLDVYDGKSWRLPEFKPSRYKDVGGTYSTGRAGQADVTEVLTYRDVGNSPTFPGVVDPSTAVVSKADGVVWDPRVGVFKMTQGRVPADASITVTLPHYPSADDYRKAQAPPQVDKLYTDIPAPPPAVQALLEQAPQNTWDRMDFLRLKLNEVVIAVGSGSPSIDVTPETAERLIAGDHKGSPFEITAVEAMLARWAGVPSRIGTGYDGVNEENGLKTVRPKNGASWIEVYFEGLGWTPIVGKPPRAQSSLDNEDQPQQDILPSDDVAVDIYVPVELESFRQLYEKLRSIILMVLPVALLLAAIWLAMPAAARELRRRRRDAWARARGPKEQILVAYATIREQATDLSVGDTYDTALEYLRRVHPDDEHTELAWLVTRVMYGDLSGHVDARDVENAEALARSIRKRMLRSQPMQTRILAILSRASLLDPFTEDLPNVRLIRVPAFTPFATAGRALRRVRFAIGRRLRGLRRIVPGLRPKVS